MRKSFNKFVEHRRIDDICWHLAYQLKRLNINTDGFLEWFAEQDHANIEVCMDQLFTEEGGFSNMLNAGWQGLKQGFSTGSKWGAGLGALGGGAGMGLATGGIGAPVGAIAGAGLGGTFGGMGGALVGGIKGMWNQAKDPQNATAIQMNPIKQNVIQSFEKIKQIYSQHQNGQQIAAVLDRMAAYLNKLQ
jgi:hypothetical protein